MLQGIFAHPISGGIAFNNNYYYVFEGVSSIECYIQIPKDAEIEIRNTGDI